MSVSDLKDNNYLSVKATVNRGVLERIKKISTDNAFLTSAGNPFHEVMGCNTKCTTAIWLEPRHWHLQ